MLQLQLFGQTTSKLFKAEAHSRPINVAGNVIQASATAMQENVLDWVKTDKRRMLHVVYRVGDLDRTIKYRSNMQHLKGCYFWYFLFRMITFIQSLCWLQILHRMSRDETTPKERYIRGTIYKCFSWIWARRFSICD